MSALPCPGMLAPAEGQPDEIGQSRTAGRPDRLTRLELSIMFFLAWQGGSFDNMKELAERLSTDYSNMTLRLRRLEELGLIVVERSGRGRSNRIKSPKIGNAI